MRKRTRVELAHEEVEPLSLETSEFGSVLHRIFVRKPNNAEIRLALQLRRGIRTDGPVELPEINIRRVFHLVDDL